MRKRILTITILATLTVGATAQQWPEMRQEAKAGARWWWLGSAVDKENLSWAMQEYAKHGIGALEITPIYGVQGNQANNIPYLSDQWMEMLRFTQEQGRTNGVEIDMATGTGWPFGGPWVPLEESASKAIFVNASFTGKSVSDLSLKVADKDEKYSKLDKVMAYWQGQSYDVTPYVKDGLLTWSPEDMLKSQMKAAESKKYKTMKKVLKLRLKELESAQWQVVAVYVRYGVMKVKRAAPGGEGLVIDHFDRQAVANYLAHIEEVFERTHTP